MKKLRIRNIDQGAIMKLNKILKIKGAINRDYTYIVFGKVGSYTEKSEKIFEVFR